LKEILREAPEELPSKSFERMEIPKDFFKIHTGLIDTLKTIGGTINPDTLSDYIKIDYRGNLENVDVKDIKKASDMMLQSLEFIKQNAETAVERKTVDTLLSYINSGKVFLCNSKEISGRSSYGCFCIENQNSSFIAIDLDNTLDYGKSELIDTLFHEAYHAAQYNAGHRNDLIKEEVHAWNLGLEMSNKYRKQAGYSTARTASYTESEMYFQGYRTSANQNRFTEIC
jgi:hypothetical protein